MVLSAYGRRRKEEMEQLEGRTVQEPGEETIDWIKRMCAINAQRCRDDPRHHEMADKWQADRDLRNAKKEERERIQAKQNEAHEKHLERERIRQRRNKALKEGKLEYYRACGRAYDNEWLRAEIVPHLPDYRSGAFLAGTGITALREGVERMRKLVGNGRPVRDKTAFVAKYARMMHEGRFTHYLDPATDDTREDLLVLEGDSPFDKHMVLDDSGAWVVPRGTPDVEWKLRIENDDGWLPGARKHEPERDKLSDIGKFDRNAKHKPFVPLGKEAPVEVVKPERTIVQPPLRHTNDAKNVPIAPQPGDPAITKAYAGPPPSPAWCQHYLFRYLPELRGHPLQPLVSQKAYGKALIETLAIERSTWTPHYRRDCFLFMLDKYHRMTERDVDLEAKRLAEQMEAQAQQVAAQQNANGRQASESNSTRMREPGED